MRVHLLHPPDRLDLLRELLPGLSFTLGDEVPEVDVLVAGRPDDAQLDRASRALVIPYAGLPKRTRGLLLERPGLAAYNLHHNAGAVAEGALALLLAAAKRVVPMDRALREHDWRPRYTRDPSVPLAGRAAVILGYGAIGRRVGAMLAGLGMDVIGVQRGDDWPLEQADVLICALPSTDETRGRLDAAALARLPTHCTLVNVGRADLIDEDALYEALADGRLHGAGLDVWYRYPSAPDERAPPSKRPFHGLDNVVLSPHRTGHGPHVEEARVRALAEVLGALRDGREPGGLVDPERGY